MLLSMKVMALVWMVLPALAAPPVVLRQVGVVDVEKGVVHRGQSVVVAEGRIREVGDARRVKVPKGAEVVDGRGKFVIPGLWDMHVHFRGGEKLIAENETWLALFVANGITGVREMGGDFTETVVKWRDEIEAGRRVGPRIVTSGPKLDGEKPSWPGSIAVTSPEQGRHGVETVQKMGAGFVKLYFSKIEEETYKAIVDEAHRRNLKVTGHLPWDMLASEAVAAGQDGIEHIGWYLLPACSEGAEELRAEFRKEGWSREQYYGKLLDRFDVGRAEALLRGMAAKGTAVTPTLVVGRSIGSMATVNHENDPRRKYIGGGIWATWNPSGGRRKPPTAEAAAVAKRRDERGTQLVGMAQRLGVTILAGSDTGVSNNFVFPAFSLHEELAALVEAGLKPAEALRAATGNAAKWLERSADFGSVEKGKVADLVLLEGNPLEDIRATRKIAGVVRGGEYLARQSLDALLEGVADKVRAGR